MLARTKGDKASTSARAQPVARPRAPRVLLIIPALNESASLPALIQEIRHACPGCDFVVIDDGSDDATAHVARRLGALVLQLPFNLGIGAAVQCGIRYAHTHGYDVCVQCDGDGQHDPSQVPVLIQPILEAKADLVNGSRFLRQGGFRSTLLRRVGIKVLCRWIWIFSGQRVTDPTSGFRAIGKNLIQEFAHSYPHEYPEPESLYSALHRGYRVMEQPVTMRARARGRSSIHTLDSALYMIKICIAILIDSLRSSAPSAVETDSAA